MCSGSATARTAPSLFGRMRVPLVSFPTAIIPAGAVSIAPLDCPRPACTIQNPLRGAPHGGWPVLPTGLVVTAAFGVFNPAIVVPAVESGWAATEPEPLLHARYEGAVASLHRLLGEPDAVQVSRAVELLRRGLEAAEGAGHPLFSGLK